MDWVSGSADCGGGISARNEGGERSRFGRRGAWRNGCGWNSGRLGWSGGRFSRVGLRLTVGGFFIDFNPTLFEPEFDFSVVTLLLGRFLKNENFNVFVVIEIIHYYIGKFRHGTRVDVTGNVVLVFVH